MQTSSKFDDVSVSIEQAITDAGEATAQANAEQDVAIDGKLADLAGSSTAKLVAAQKSNDAKFAKIDEVAIETAATLAELGEATKASGLYNLKTLPKCEKKFVGLQRLLTTQLQMCT